MDNFKAFGFCPVKDITLADMKIMICEIQKLQQNSLQHESLPCKAVPVEFVIEEPECADKLLTSMNITNVRIMQGQ